MSDFIKFSERFFPMAGLYQTIHNLPDDNRGPQPVASSAEEDYKMNLSVPRAVHTPAVVDSR